MSIKNERWAPVVGHELTHEVSTLGRVRRFDESLCTIGSFESGYSRVSIANSSYRVHRLVLAAFRGPCPASCEGAHENGIKADCRLDNLAWKTKLENHADKQRHGTTARGTRHGLSKLTPDSVRAIRASSDTTSALSRAFGVSRPVIHSVKIRRTWKHVA